MSSHPGSEMIGRRGRKPPERSYNDSFRGTLSNVRGNIPKWFRGGIGLVWLGVGSFLEVCP